VHETAPGLSHRPRPNRLAGDDTSHARTYEPRNKGVDGQSRLGGKRSRVARAWENRAVGLRESINQRPRLVTVVTVAVIVLSLVAIVLEQRALSPRGGRQQVPVYDGPAGDADRPVGDDEPQPGGRRPAAEPATRATSSPRATLG
jgi:hypothetical protein